MSETTDTRARLLEILKKRSIFYGNFTLSSGGKSNYIIDFKLTTLDPEGAFLTGKLLHQIIRDEEARRGISIDSIGGLTMGADSISVAVGMTSHMAGDAKPLQVFCVRKEPKGYGKGKQVEGNFKEGDLVVVIDDVITQGSSTLKAIEAIEQAGGKVAFVVVMGDRMEGGRKKIEDAGYHVIPAFTREDILDQDKLDALKASEIK